VAGWWFSPGTPVSATNKTDRHDITETLLKVAKPNQHYLIFLFIMNDYSIDDDLFLNLM
jgi:hypothetical protein